MLLGHAQLMDFFNKTCNMRISKQEVQHLINHIAIRGDLHHRDGFINLHELDHAVHKQHLQIVHEMALLSSGHSRLAEQIRLGEAQLKPDAHSRYREQHRREDLDPTAAAHRMRQKLARGPRSLGQSVFKPRHEPHWFADGSAGRTSGERPSSANGFDRPSTASSSSAFYQQNYQYQRQLNMRPMTGYDTRVGRGRGRGSPVLSESISVPRFKKLQPRPSPVTWKLAVSKSR
jgi:hypothetical protein